MSTFKKLAKKVSPLIATVFLMAIFVPAFADTASTYAKSCGACHDTGALNAPKKGDTPLWDKLISQKGMDGLVNSTKKGMTQMPAMGLCPTCSDDEFASLIDYMKK